MTIYSLDVLLFLFGTSLLFHVQLEHVVLTAASWPTYRFLQRQVRWSGIPISFKIFHSLLWSTQSKALAKIDVFLELSCFFHDPADVGNLISGYKLNTSAQENTLSLDFLLVTPISPPPEATTNLSPSSFSCHLECSPKQPYILPVFWPLVP